MSQELLVTKSGVVIFLAEVCRGMGMPSGTPAYSISTDLRDDYPDRAILTADEATEVALAILSTEFKRKRTQP